MNVNRKDKSQTEIKIGSPVMSKNDRFAAENRAFFNEKRIFAVNLISSPGSGKTTILERMPQHLERSMAVIVGDVQTDRDAARIRKTGCPVQQIETGGACHLDAQRVAHALERLDLGKSDCKILVIENVGNLVCPSTFDLGEHMKIAVLSVPEGDDKVLKYPSIFSRISILLINKIDLLAHIEFNAEKAEAECRSINAGFSTFRISAKTGEGVEAFCRHLLAKRSESLG